MKYASLLEADVIIVWGDNDNRNGGDDDEHSNFQGDTDLIIDDFDFQVGYNYSPSDEMWFNNELNLKPAILCVSSAAKEFIVTNTLSSTSNLKKRWW